MPSGQEAEAQSSGLLAKCIFYRTSSFSLPVVKSVTLDQSEMEILLDVYSMPSVLPTPPPLPFFLSFFFLKLQKSNAGREASELRKSPLNY